MKRLILLLMATSLISSCKSNSDTSTSGSGASVSENGILVTAYIDPAEGEDGKTPSMDAYNRKCVTGTEPGIRTLAGIFVVKISDIVDMTGGIFPQGLILNRYTVSYTSESKGAPDLAPRNYAEDFPITMDRDSDISSITAKSQVILVPIELLPEYRRQDSAQGRIPFNYNVKVNYRGKDLSGKAFTISASTFVEIADFNRCAK